MPERELHGICEIDAEGMGVDPREFTRCGEL